MTGRAGALLRGGLVLLTAIAAVQGAWMYLSPRSFYDNVPTVSASGPFSRHLMSDVGGLNLAIAAVLGCAAVWLERRLARVALAAYLVYAVPHLLFHLTHLTGLSAGGTAFLVTGLSLLPALSLALLLLTAWPGAGVRVWRTDPADPRQQ